jgi:hypothetical protein
MRSGRVDLISGSAIRSPRSEGLLTQMRPPISSTNRRISLVLTGAPIFPTRGIIALCESAEDPETLSGREPIPVSLIAKSSETRLPSALALTSTTTHPRS